jgi:t-SNARE complex subunit (syntaxin)
MGSEFNLSNNSTQTDTNDAEKDVINEEKEVKKFRKYFNPKCSIYWILHIVILFIFDICIFAVNYFY